MWFCSDVVEFIKIAMLLWCVVLENCDVMRDLKQDVICDAMKDREITN